MANYALLLSSVNTGPPETDPEDDSIVEDVPLLESAYAIPALWFTIFDAECIKTYMDPDDNIEIRYLVTPLDAALERAHSSIATFTTAFSDGDAYCTQWLTFLRQQDCAYLKADIEEILQMADLPNQLRLSLGFLYNPTPESTAAFFSLTSLPAILSDSNLIHRPASNSEYSTIQRLTGIVAD